MAQQRGHLNGGTDKQLRQLTDIAVKILRQARVSGCHDQQGCRFILGTHRHRTARDDRLGGNLVIALYQFVAHGNQVGGRRIIGLQRQTVQLLDQPRTSLGQALLNTVCLTALTQARVDRIQVTHQFGAAQRIRGRTHQCKTVQRVRRHLDTLVGLLHQHAADDTQGNKKQDTDQAKLHAVGQPVH